MKEVNNMTYTEMRNSCCVWRLSESQFCTFDSDCGAELEVINTSDVIKNWEYCPYCGKKIKVEI